MRILMFTRFSQMGANSRYRLLQYIPLFEDAGHQVEVRAMLDDAYLKVMYSSGRRSGWTHCADMRAGLPSYAVSTSTM